MRNGFGNICMFELLQDHNHSQYGDDFQLVMDRIDLDGDGRIDYHEFMQAAINHQALINKENIEQMFKLFDANNDGMISITELRNAFSAKAQKESSIDTFVKEVM